MVSGVTDLTRSSKHDFLASITTEFLFSDVMWESRSAFIERVSIDNIGSVLVLLSDSDLEVAFATDFSFLAIILLLVPVVSSSAPYHDYARFSDRPRSKAALPL